MKSVAILFGFTEGAMMANRMNKALVNSGYNIASSPDEADILIAHSGGCFIVDDYKKARRVLMVNPPFWPEKSLLARTVGVIKTDVRYGLRPKAFLHWVYKTVLHFYYIPRRPLHNYKIARQALTYDLHKVIATLADVQLVRNSDDAWLTPNLESLKKAYPDMPIYHIYGDHDDLWRNPQKYVDLLKK